MSEHDTDKGHDSYKNRELAAAAIIHRSISPVPTTSASPDGISSPTLATALNLTAHQKQLLVQSWPEVHTYNRIHGGDAIFARFCEKNSIASESVLRKHEQYLLQLLSKAVENLNNDCEPLLKECLAYGAQHTTLQVLLDETVWDQLAEAVIERIHMVSFVRRHKKLSKAWIMLVTLLVEKIREGYGRCTKQKNLRRPTEWKNAPFQSYWILKCFHLILHRALAAT
ncbi:globin [Trichuris trichiura]|uniref:Globin n=1 Tax=Trichuris trichiura TaxID=36087 RepID=A0A077Z629_TRITR|nr:globin [Trichuris trichiura]